MRGPMNQATMPLPIRLVPRKGHQLGMLLFFCVFFGFALFWMAGAAGIVDLNDGTVRWPSLEEWLGNLFPLFGLPFAAIGLWGILVALLKMRPASPNFHLQLHSEGLVIKSLFKLRRHAWATLPPFETIEVVRRTKSGRSYSYYTVAVETAAALPDAPADPTHRREVLRIQADEYGAKNKKEDAEALTAWFNALRDQARDGRLQVHEMVAVPEGFRATAISVTAAPRGPLAGRSAPVIQTADRSGDRPPTVVRR